MTVDYKPSGSPPQRTFSFPNVCYTTLSGGETLWYVYKHLRKYVRSGIEPWYEGEVVLWRPIKKPAHIPRTVVHVAQDAAFVEGIASETDRQLELLVRDKVARAVRHVASSQPSP